MKKIISTVVSGLLVLHSSAYAEIIKGIPVPADDWIKKSALKESVSKTFEPYRDTEFFAPLTASSKVYLQEIEKQQTAADLGYIVAQPDPVQVAKPFNWTYVYVIAAALGGAGIGYAARG